MDFHFQCYCSSSFISLYQFPVFDSLSLAILVQLQTVWTPKQVLELYFHIFLITMKKEEAFCLA